MSSGSSIEESGSVYDSHHSSISSDGEGNESAIDSNESDHAFVSVLHDAQDGKEKALINVSDASVDYDLASQSSKGNLSSFISTDLAESMSKSALESWLDEQPASTSVKKPPQPSPGRISINNLNCTVRPMLHTLLHPTTGNGLRVEYAFSYEISTISPILVLLEVFLENCSSEPLVNIALKDGESTLGVESSDQVMGKPERYLSAPFLIIFFALFDLDSYFQSSSSYILWNFLLLILLL